MAFEKRHLCCYVTRHCAVLLVAVGFCLGCGEERIATYPVSGKVLYADGTPLPLGGRVRLVNESVTPPITAEGRISDDGTVSELTTFQAGDGAIAGEYFAIVIPVIPDDKGSMSRAEFDSASFPMDMRFKGFKTSGLKFTVSADQPNEFKFEITRPRRK